MTLGRVQWLDLVAVFNFCVMLTIDGVGYVVTDK